MSSTRASVAVLADISLRSPRKLLFLLSKNIFTGSKYPKNKLFNFEKNFTDHIPVLTRARQVRPFSQIKHPILYGESTRKAVECLEAKCYGIVKNNDIDVQYIVFVSAETSVQSPHQLLTVGPVIIELR